jgi:hypothetical protein
MSPYTIKVYGGESLHYTVNVQGRKKIPIYGKRAGSEKDPLESPFLISK